MIIREKERERYLRELAMEISLTSFGSSQTLPFPHFRTLAESRFWSFNDTISLFLDRSPSHFAAGRIAEAFYVKRKRLFIAC